jgi:error-prone DNA polymerase
MISVAQAREAHGRPGVRALAHLCGGAAEERGQQQQVERLQRARVVPCGFLRNDERTPAGRILSLVGLVLVRQRPSTAKGIVFMTIEDETGPANLVIRPKAYERLRRVARHAAAVLAEGRVESRSGVTHLVVRRLTDLGDVFAAPGRAVAPPSRDFR